MGQSGYTSNDNYTGSWDDAATWNRSPLSLPVTPGSNIGGSVTYINSYGRVTRSGNIKLGSNVVLTVYDTLLVDGNVEVSGQSSLIVESGGVLVITGNFIASGGSVSTNDGKIVVQGDLNASGSSSISNNTNDFYVYGTATGSGGSSLTGTYSDEAALSSNDSGLYTLVSGGTLPVEFLYVKATASFDKVVIKWATASELNNDFFTVERSKDGVNFETVASVNGAGTSEKVNNYEIDDNNAYSGTSYYRVKQTDYDGQFEYSGMITIVNNSVADVQLNIYPNPAVDQVKIDISRLGSVKVEIMDINGVSVYSEEFNGEFTSAAQIDVTSFPKGMYYVNLKTRSHAVSKNLLIK
ncbi:Hypothetical protein C900_05476 [Fulvivirga imtechensis AK7]|uniref:Secretion system C-terminal sorting domain-containing protein n=2 Tax=Fulvivirga TaxID=396811 RepID=L8JNY0_9BACT|nr:Hypothetical protein C900_05476 [Fulvivirga imtechensis AK7]